LARLLGVFYYWTVGGAGGIGGVLAGSLSGDGAKLVEATGVGSLAGTGGSTGGALGATAAFGAAAATAGFFTMKE